LCARLQYFLKPFLSFKFTTWLHLFRCVSKFYDVYLNMLLHAVSFCVVQDAAP
jgi:hypothetical protein